MRAWIPGFVILLVFTGLTAASAPAAVPPARAGATPPASPAPGAAKPPANIELDCGKGVKLKLIYVDPGKFTMGSPQTEQGRDSRETPHPVTLTKGFYIGACEVTQEQYQAVMGVNPSSNKGPANPVEQVSWEDAVKFCKALSGKAGTVRLPTEAQWEYACRAGSVGAVSGDARLDDVAWHSGNAEGKSHPVGTKKPNAWGLYDMHGNVSEWCADWDGDYPADAVTDPAGPEDGSDRVARGGAAQYGAIAVLYRCAFRGAYHPGYRHASVGFRVILQRG